MPCDYKQYPKNWKWISAQVRKRNDGRCELCYAPNGEMVVRTKYGDHPWRLISDTGDKKVKVVLTVHHIDSNHNNNSEQNLISLCQRCHCRLNLADHIKHSKETRAKKKALKNQVSLSIL